MFDRHMFYERHCVQSLIDVVEQAPVRWFARGCPVVSDATSGLLLLWTILRWERTFLIRCLEGLHVDLDSLAREVDDRLREMQGATVAQPDTPTYGVFSDIIPLWLDRAQQQAQLLGHSYLGNEHLFLALLAEDQEPLRSVFAKFNLDHEQVKNAILESISQSSAGSPGTISPDNAVWAIPVKEGFWGAIWDKKPGASLPRRFGTAVLMLHMTLFAVIFSVLRVLDASLVYYLLTAVFVLGVALGQMFLFQSKYPRAASIWTGAVLLPLESVLAMIFVPGLPTEARIEGSICCLIGCIPLGGFFGYLSGGLTAGIVLVLDLLAERKKTRKDTETAEDWR
jgi:hypothetical protein